MLNKVKTFWSSETVAYEINSISNSSMLRQLFNGATFEDMQCYMILSLSIDESNVVVMHISWNNITKVSTSLGLQKKN